MKSLIVFFLFVTTVGYSQSSEFNFNDYKAYKMTINNLPSSEQAMYLARLTEKNLLSEFTWIDYTAGMGYFIIKKENSCSEIEKLIGKTYNLTVSDSKELILNDDFFLNMYLQKGGIKGECVLNQPPNYVYLGKGNESKTELFYHIAKEIWVKKYPEYYNAYYTNNSEKKGSKEEMPRHYPIYVNTGNVEYDSSAYDKAKQEWIKNYPEEVEQLTKMILSK